jgi:hypothetical protein
VLAVLFSILISSCWAKRNGWRVIEAIWAGGLKYGIN